MASGKVLVIDDDPGVLGFLRRVLSAEQLTVVTAQNVADAFQLLDDREVRIVVTDLFMPGEPRGIELVRQIRAKRPECPLLVISGYPSADMFDQCRKLGVTDFLTKPFEMGFVREVLRRLLSESSASERSAP
jgi:DNA-binding NtrC family response regulator